MNMREGEPVYIFRRSITHDASMIVLCIMVLGVFLYVVDSGFFSMLSNTSDFFLLFMMLLLPIASGAGIWYSIHRLRHDKDSLKIYRNGVEGYPWGQSELCFTPFEQIKEANFIRGSKNSPALLELMLHGSSSDKVCYSLTCLADDSEKAYDQLGFLYNQWKKGELTAVSQGQLDDVQTKPGRKQASYGIYLVVIIACLFVGLKDGYLTYGDEQSSIEFQGMPLFLLIVAMLMGASNLISKLFDKGDRNNKNSPQRKFESVTAIGGWALFVASFLLAIF